MNKEQMRRDVGEWSDEYLHSRLAEGQETYEPEGWRILQAEAQARGLSEKAEVASTSNLAKAAVDTRKMWGMIGVGIVVMLLGGGLSNYSIVLGVIVIGAGVGTLRGAWKELKRLRDNDGVVNGE